MSMDPAESYLRPTAWPAWSTPTSPPCSSAASARCCSRRCIPLAMAGVAEHSNYQADPLGRLRRTADFVGTTTFGTARRPEKAIAQVQRVHRRVKGIAPDGRPYSAGDPELVTFIHVAEMSSFLESARRFGPRDLTPEQCDQYYDEMAPVATGSRSRAGYPGRRRTRTSYFRRIRPELYAGPQARQARDWLRHGVARRPRRARRLRRPFRRGHQHPAPVGPPRTRALGAGLARSPGRHRGGHPGDPRLVAAGLRWVTAGAQTAMRQPAVDADDLTGHVGRPGQGQHDLGHVLGPAHPFERGRLLHHLRARRPSRPSRACR